MPAPSKSEEAVGAKITSNYTNIAKIGSFGDDFWRLRFFMGQFGQKCHFITFRALQRGFFRFFFRKISNSHFLFQSPLRSTTLYIYVFNPPLPYSRKSIRAIFCQNHLPEHVSLQKFIILVRIFCGSCHKIFVHIFLNTRAQSSKKFAFFYENSLTFFLD